MEVALFLFDPAPMRFCDMFACMKISAVRIAKFDATDLSGFVMCHATSQKHKGMLWDTAGLCLVSRVSSCAFCFYVIHCLPLLSLQALPACHLHAYHFAQALPLMAHPSVGSLQQGLLVDVF